MPFPAEEKRKLLAVKGIGPDVIIRLEPLGFNSLAQLARADAREIVQGAAARAVRSVKTMTNEIDGFFRQARRRPASALLVREGDATTHGGKRHDFMPSFWRNGLPSGSSCWKNSPQARTAIEAAIEAASSASAEN